jgi:hypothetical protein
MSPDSNVRAAAFLKMVGVIEAGGKVVVGAEVPLDEGAEVGRTCDGKVLTVLARSTRQAFEEHMPKLGASPEKLAAYFAAYHPPYYYELEVWDMIVDGPRGRLAFRIKMGGR